MAQGRISKRSVDALQCPPGKDREILWDDAVSGFGVAAYPTGKKVYIVQYRQGGRSRRAVVGDHGRMTPEKARSEAKKLLGLVETGHDPIKAKKAERAIPTFQTIATDFMGAPAERKARTMVSYESLLRLHILPAIGKMKVTDIRRADVKALHDKLIDHPGTANLARAVISVIWEWAAAEREDEDFPPNPTRTIKRFKEEKREQFLTNDQLSRLGDALAEAETVGLPFVIDESNPKAKHAPKVDNRRRRLDPFAIAAIRLLILTGARLREILHARWDEIDFERGLLNLPSNRSKTGKKSIFLSAPALATLQALPRVDGNPHVIVGEGIDEKGIGKPRADLKKPWAAITQAAKLSDLRIHDLRHSFASVGAGSGMGLPIIGKLLGHSQPSTTARYAHLDSDPMRRAVDTIGSTIDAALNKNAGRKRV